MSSRARRIRGEVEVQEYDWRGADGGRAAMTESYPPDTAKPKVAPKPAEPPPPAAPVVIDATQQAHLATLEREAFAKGYEQGERAGTEAGAKRAEAMLRRLAQTLDELADVRRSMIHQTERQMVQLALSIAKRIVRREVLVDRELTLAMARVALDRLGDSTAVTIRLHPDDYDATAARRDVVPAGSRVTVVADGAVSRGGCLVQSEFGFVDASVDAQFQEIARALLAEESQEVPAGGHAR